MSCFDLRVKMPKENRVFMRNCAYPYCQFRGSTGFFKIPSNVDQCDQWLKACNLPSFKSRDVICRQHFKQTDVYMKNDVTHLKLGSIPISFHQTYTSQEIFTISASDLNSFIGKEEIANGLDEKVICPSADDNDCSENSNEVHTESDHDYAFNCVLCNNGSKLIELDSNIKKLKQSLLHWKTKYGNLEKKYEELKNLPSSSSLKGKKIRDDITLERLLENGHFSKPQIEVMLRYNKTSNPNAYSKNWTKNDFLVAKQLYGLRAKSLEFVRKTAGLPLPSERTIREKFKFMKVNRGYATPALVYLKNLMPRILENEKLCALKFDEMKISESAIYDSRLDAVLGPNKYVNQILVRGIFKNWSYPIYLDFDMPLSKHEYNQCIFHLEEIGAKVLISACDQGPQNIALAKELGVSINKQKVENPFDASRFVLFSFDFIHIFKNLRNHLLDDFCKLDGIIFAKEDFEDLLKKLPFGTLGIKLKPRHLNCKMSDRQNVRLAVELLSESTSMLMKDLFPNCPKKNKLSDLIALFDKCWNLMTSVMSTSAANDFIRAPLRECLQQQLPHLHEFLDVIDKMQFQLRKSKKKAPKWSKIPSQKGAIISVKSAIQLQEILSDDYNEPKFGTEVITQDDLECFFGIKRGQDGTNDTPSALQYNNRVSSGVTQAILMDTDFDIFSMENQITECQLYNYNYEPLNSDLFEKCKKAKPTAKPKKTRRQLTLFAKMERYHVAGVLAYKFKNDPTLAMGQDTDIEIQTSSLYVSKSIRESTMISPSTSWISDVNRMYLIFSRHHPLPNLRLGPGLIKDFTDVLAKEFPNRDRSILHEFALIRTNKQIKILNERVSQGKSSTARGARNLVQTIYT